MPLLQPTPNLTLFERPYRHTLFSSWFVKITNAADLPNFPQPFLILRGRWEVCRGCSSSLVQHWLQTEMSVSQTLWVTGLYLPPSLSPEWPCFARSHSNKHLHFSSCFASFSSVKTANCVMESTWSFKVWAGWSLFWWAATHPTDTILDLGFFRISPQFSFCHASSLYTCVCQWLIVSLDLD